MVAVAVLVGMSSMWAESRGVGVLIEANDFRQLLKPFATSQQDADERQFVAVSGAHTTLADTISVAAQASDTAGQRTADAKTSSQHAIEPDEGRVRQRIKLKNRQRMRYRLNRLS